MDSEDKGYCDIGLYRRRGSYMMSGYQATGTYVRTENGKIF
jgi:hypothetical protein